MYTEEDKKDIVKENRPGWIARQIDRLNALLEDLNADLKQMDTDVKVWAAKKQAQRFRSEDSFWKKLNPKNWFRKKKKD